ncbi:Uncharacterised protein [Serratia quinivorans]|nr:Uncharacterised protein [Serratia proteamaculans]CAI1094937.1 Uncharacterised protein [Serratia proteamaculans]CAI1129953.1 Uncharacterised protein [Serratia proteamaculans]CAI1663263.1 Uncharacterised protein [Serratia proteamaculans]SPZ57077.1 Uncharacterised protein [Serratia quinivorans]
MNIFPPQNHKRSLKSNHRLASGFDPQGFYRDDAFIRLGF